MHLGYFALVVALLFALITLPACGVQASVYRVDEAKMTQSQKSLPLKCLFVECGGVK